ncbi:MAG: M2 family metallopeptidase [Gemmatimonadota bacterium]|nr:M2 family metallopeptidase [Gemmatimonadota bacterium]
MTEGRKDGTAGRRLVGVLVVLLASPLTAQQPTLAAARRFIDQAETQLEERSVHLSRTEWVAATYITHDTELLSAAAQADYGRLVQRLATEAARYDGVSMPTDLRRRFLLLKLSLSAPPPADSALGVEMARLQTGLEADYGRGTYCQASAGGTRCLTLNDLTRILAQSRDPAELLDVWRGWHAIAPPMRDRYARFVALANQGAQTLGFRDAGAMWRAAYDMPPDTFAAEIERLWEQVRPLYVALHAYVRHRLSDVYGPALVPPDGAMPAHLLGNMWAQDWANVFPLVAPRGAGPGYDLTAILRERVPDARQMVRYGENFFLSLGFDSLPTTFWERSQFTRPQDRDVVCHASAWDVDNRDDLRIKMCIEPTAEDFVTIHHELGHNFYQRAYKDQGFLYQTGAHDGFHEAIGDAIALAITPDYLVKVGLLDRAPAAAADTALLLRQALDRVAFLPFGLLIDQWRWRVFSGDIAARDYNRVWWDLRMRYQGVAPPGPRAADAFDPGAKYHVPANVPYTRYFLAGILQFQFYRALCREAGYVGPLHRCSFYGSAAAGAKLRRMLALGASRPWPEALEALTGQRDMDASAILEYFAPLRAWLDRQTGGVPVGW